MNDGSGLRKEQGEREQHTGQGGVPWARQVSGLGCHRRRLGVKQPQERN